jgi:hypothetical protein
MRAGADQFEVAADFEIVVAEWEQCLRENTAVWVLPLAFKAPDRVFVNPRLVVSVLPSQVELF